MRGIDTNVLVRYLAQDDVAQAKAVDKLVKAAIAEGKSLHVDDVVLCETVWVLRAAYGQDKASIVSVLEKILATSQFSFDDRDLLTRAVSDFRGGKGDFADYVIGRRNRRAGCDRTVTFDRSLKGSGSFSVL
jgi:predicted nucleic-acid-binding protein